MPAKYGLDAALADSRDAKEITGNRDSKKAETEERQPCEDQKSEKCEQADLLARRSENGRLLQAGWIQDKQSQERESKFINRAIIREIVLYASPEIRRLLRACNSTRKDRSDSRWILTHSMRLKAMLYRCKRNCPSTSTFKSSSPC